MKLVFAILFLVNCSYVTNSHNTYLSKGKICTMTVGSKIEDLERLSNNPAVEKVMMEGEYYLRYTFDLQGCGVVKALLGADNTTVYRLETTSTDLFTKEGARVGMSLIKLKSIYPRGKLAFQWDGSDENQYSFILPNYEGVFVFDAREIMDKCGYKHPSCEEYMLELKAVSFFTF